MKILVIIPAKTDSTRLPKKNIQKIKGKTLVEYSIDYAKQSKYNPAIIVSSESDEVLKIALDNEVMFEERPAHLLKDAEVTDVYLNIVEEMTEKYDLVVCLQPDNPNRSNTLDECIQYMIENNYDDLITVNSNYKRSGSVRIFKFNYLKNREVSKRLGCIKDEAIDIHYKEDLELIKNNNIEHLTLNSPLYDAEVNQIYDTLDYAPSIIFDIGANIGGFSTALSKKFPRSHIYAFEPVAETFSILQSNIKEYNNIDLYNVGLSNKNKQKVPIGMPIIPSYAKHNYGRATIHGFVDNPIDYINLVKFSQVCKENNIYPDMIKIDAEGCEYEILSDAKDSGILSKVNIIYIEINNDWEESSQRSKHLLLEDFEIVGDSGYNSNNKEPLNYIFKRRI